MDVSNIKIPIKTVVAIVLWAGSMIGIYYVMKFKVDSTESKVQKLEKVIEKNNPELLEYKITNLEKQVTKLNDKADKIYELLNEGN
jgi:septation ring formation regulator EzrA